MTFYYNGTDPERKTKADALKPVAGYCVLVDIVNSTKMKDGAAVSHWCESFCSTFLEVEDHLQAAGDKPHVIQPLKVIGDEAMYYIPEMEMQESPLWFFQGVCCIAKYVTESIHHCRCRIGVAYCQDVYPITFRPCTVDFYGKDIDLTSRLVQEVAQEGEVAMNEPFYTKVKTSFEDLAELDRGRFPEFTEDLDDGELRCLKGFTMPVMVYRCRPQLRPE